MAADNTNVRARRSGRRQPGIVGDLEHFRLRVLQDAMNDGLAATWERRARQFEAALPREGDFQGRDVTPAQRAERERALRATIAACRARAAAARLHDGIDADVAHALRSAEADVMGRAS